MGPGGNRNEQKVQKEEMRRGDPTVKWVMGGRREAGYPTIPPVLVGILTAFLTMTDFPLLGPPWSCPYWCPVRAVRRGAVCMSVRLYLGEYHG